MCTYNIVLLGQCMITVISVSVCRTSLLQYANILMTFEHCLDLLSGTFIN